MDIADVSQMKAKLNRREDELRSLIDNLDERDFRKRSIGVFIELDWETLTVLGHGFGGTTALHAGINNEKVRYVVSLSPWLLPVRE
jgi:hypothetical protein